MKQELPESAQDQKDLRLIIQIRNNHLYKFRTERGWTQRDMANAAGVRESEYGEIERLIKYPTKRDDAWSEAALRLSSLVGIIPEVLFPEAFSHIEKTKIEREVSAEQVVAAITEGQKLLANPIELIAEKEKNIALEEALETLTERERLVLRLRFGLETGHEVFLKDIGSTLGICAERVREIEAKALRKLRHPSRARKIKEYSEYAD